MCCGEIQTDVYCDCLYLRASFEWEFAIIACIPFFQHLPVMIIAQEAEKVSVIEITGLKIISPWQQEGP